MMTKEQQRLIAAHFMVGHYIHSQVPKEDVSKFTMPYTIEVPKFITLFPSFEDDPKARDEFINHVFNLGIKVVTREFSSSLFESTKDCAKEMKGVLDKVIEEYRHVQGVK